jgi:hypothetical protein
MRSFTASSDEKQPRSAAGTRRDRLTEVVCLALTLALLTLAGRIVALW